MTARTATIQDVDRRQVEAYRRMTGEERLRIGLGLYEASLGIAREAIRARFPDADAATIEEKLRQRIRVGCEIEAMNHSSPPTSFPVSVPWEGRQNR